MMTRPKPGPAYQNVVTVDTGVQLLPLVGTYMSKKDIAVTM